MLHQDPVSQWHSTGYVDYHDRIESWEQVLRDSHLPWTLAKSPDQSFAADVGLRSFLDYRLVECNCGPVSGFRNSTEISDTDAAYFCLLYLKQGREDIAISGKHLQLNEGDIMLWDSTQKMDFSVPEEVRKLSLVIPESALVSILPRAHDYAGTIIKSSTTMGAMIANHLDKLHSEMFNLETSQITSLMRPSLELLSVVLESQAETTLTSPQRHLLNSATKFALDNLQRPDLSPKLVAAELGISTRYLHMLFAQQEDTFSAWIKRQRLHRCREELRKDGKKSISEISFRWGFNDFSHFSKSFKEAFGCSPRAFVRDLTGED